MYNHISQLAMYIIAHSYSYTLLKLVPILYHVTCTIAVSCNQCADTVTVGSLGHGNTISENKTYILAGYEVLSGATVVAWEFCYQKTDVASVTFYPGIWRIRENGNTDYELVQSNAITYDPSGSTDQLPCLIFNLSVTDQFTVSEESVVGLYSNDGALLLHTNIDNAVTTYEDDGNQSHIDNFLPKNINFNIAIRVHLGKYIALYIQIKMYKM